MKKQTIVIASLFILLLLFLGGSYFYKNADHSVTGEKTTALEFQVKSAQNPMLLLRIKK
jgi:preprotein translocase subunit SecG